mgnify:CR=1 FL=1
MHKLIFGFTTLIVCFFLLQTQTQAAPYFFLNGEASVNASTYTISVYLNTDSSTITAAQTIIDFDTTYLIGSTISIASSRCSFWAPANPALGYGSNPTPYFQGGDKIAIACGFSNPGYTTTSGTGAFIASIRFNTVTAGATTLSFDDTNTIFNFIASSIAPGAMSDFNLNITGTTGGATPTPSATPTSTPQVGCNEVCNSTPDCSGSLFCHSSGFCRNTLCPTESNCICPTATPTATAVATATPTSTNSSSGVSDTLTADDLTFVEVGSNGSGNTVSDDTTPLQAVDQDDSIPLPPELEPRARATPFLFSLLGGGGGTSQGGDGSAGQGSGEVLAAQSLRELLIPGKSSADKTVVLVNLISTLTFLALLAIVIWRLVTITRLNKVKSKHMQEYLASELSAIQSKIGSVDNPQSRELLKQELNDTLQKINTGANDK